MLTGSSLFTVGCVSQISLQVYRNIVLKIFFPPFLESRCFFCSVLTVLSILIGGYLIL